MITPMFGTVSVRISGQNGNSSAEESRNSAKIIRLPEAGGGEGVSGNTCFLLTPAKGRRGKPFAARKLHDKPCRNEALCGSRNAEVLASWRSGFLPIGAISP
jgi:hypothetical protein